MMRNFRFFILFFLLAVSCKTTRMSTKEAIDKLGPNPYFEIDGKEIDRSELNNYPSIDIASILIHYDNDAIKLYGDKAKDGAAIFTTKVKAMETFEAILKVKSKDCDSIFNNTDREQIQYIINDKPLTKNFGGELSGLSLKNIKKITILNKIDLVQDYNIENKEIGLLISTKRKK